MYIDEDYPRYQTTVLADLNLFLLDVYDEDNLDPGITQAHTGIIVQSSCTGSSDYFNFIGRFASVENSYF